MRKFTGRKTRQKRIREKIKGTSTTPRLNVFRSNKHFYGALINDEEGKTILALDDKKLKKGKGRTKTDDAFGLGVLLGEKASVKKIKKAVFDRAGYKYHGRVKAFAEGARKGGLKF